MSLTSRRISKKAREEIQDILASFCWGLLGARSRMSAKDSDDYTSNDFAQRAFKREGKDHHDFNVRVDMICFEIVFNHNRLLNLDTNK